VRPWRVVNSHDWTNPCKTRSAKIIFRICNFKFKLFNFTFIYIRIFLHIITYMIPVVGLFHQIQKSVRIFPIPLLGSQKSTSLLSCCQIHTSRGMALSKWEYVKSFESEETLLPNCWAVGRLDGRGKDNNNSTYVRITNINALLLF